MVLPQGTTDTNETDQQWERRVLRLLSDGHIGEVRLLLADADTTSMFVRMAGADAGVRVLDIDVSDVEVLRNEVYAVTAPGDPLRFWSDAMLAERLVLEPDAFGYLLARQALTDLGDQPLPPPITRYARARLRAVIAVALLFTPVPSSLAEHRVLRDGALSDLYRLGFANEAACVRGVLAGVHAVLNEEDLREAFEQLTDARRCIPDDGLTALGSTVDCFLIITGLDLGEVDAAHAAARRLAASTASVRGHRATAGYLLDLAAVDDGADIDLAGLEAQIDTLAALTPLGVHAAYGHLAHVLFDRGHAGAGRVARQSASLPGVWPTLDAERDLLATRAHLADGHGPALPDIVEVLDVLERNGRRRHAGRAAIRIARDLARAGRAPDARNLLAWGLDRVPAAGLRAASEHTWIDAALAELDRSAGGGGRTERSVGGAAPLLAARSPRLRIRVLTPMLEVAVDGAPVPVGDTPAKLLLALVLAHPGPVHVEQLADRLWPSEPFTQTRSRLNTVLHRLRRSLGAGAAAIVRREDTVILDGQACDIDLVRYRRALAGGPEAQAAALASVAGNLCSALHPYDEDLVGERHVFLADWLDRAHALQRAGVLAREDLADVRLCLGVSRDEFVEDEPFPSRRQR